MNVPQFTWKNDSCISGEKTLSYGIHTHSPPFNFRTSLSVYIFIFYRFTCSFEMQVDPLACFLIVLFHILLSKAQERVHADIQAAI